MFELKNAVLERQQSSMPLLSPEMLLQSLQWELCGIKTHFSIRVYS